VYKTHTHTNTHQNNKKEEIIEYPSESPQHLGAWGIDGRITWITRYRVSALFHLRWAHYTRRSSESSTLSTIVSSTTNVLHLIANHEGIARTRAKHGTAELYDSFASNRPWHTSARPSRAPNRCNRGSYARNTRCSYPSYRVFHANEMFVSPSIHRFGFLPRRRDVLYNYKS